jgi:hypothetical protein
LEAFKNFDVLIGCCTQELNAVCPDGFEYHFVDEEFVVGRVAKLQFDR